MATPAQLGYEPSLPQGAEVPKLHYEVDDLPKNLYHNQIEIYADDQGTIKTDRVHDWVYFEYSKHNKLCYLFRTRGFCHFRDYSIIRTNSQFRCNYCCQHAIHSAVLYGDVGIVHLVLKHGADVNIQNIYGETPLHLACIQGDVTIVLYLLKNGANVNIRDFGNMTALHIGVVMNQFVIVGHLLYYGAKVDEYILDRDMVTPVTEAVKRGLHFMVCTLVFCDAAINSPDIHGQTPLYYAVERGDELTTTFLLEYGADVNIKYIGGRSILHIATMTGLEKCVELLLKAGTDPNAVDASKMNCLHLAAVTNNVQLVKPLVQYGCDIDARDRWMRTPVHQATLHKKSQMLECLFDNGASVQDAKKALMKAMKYRLREMIKILTRRGVTIQDN